ncbi:hypothetical protein HDV00_009798, partial [Rhizophlyctis rosea]
GVGFWRGARRGRGKGLDMVEGGRGKELVRRKESVSEDVVDLTPGHVVRPHVGVSGDEDIWQF